MEALESRVLLAATHLFIGLQPSNGYAGAVNAFPLEVEVQDGGGNIVTTDTSKVHVSVKTGPGSLSGTTTVAAAAGVVNFTNLVFSKPGTYILQVSDGSLTQDMSTSIVVSPAPAATTLVFSQPPVGNPVGAAITTPVGVTIMDQYGNVFTKPTSISLAIDTGPAGGHLSGKTTAKTTNGIATFGSVAVNKGGSYVLQAKSGKITVNSDAFNMGGPPVATALQFVQQPGAVTAGMNMTPAASVEVLDQYGNVLTSDHSTLKLSIATGPTTKGSFTASAKAGLASFGKLHFASAGSYTLTATDGKLPAITSDSFTVSAAAATHLAFIQIPASGTLHTDPSTVTVEVLDKFNNIVLTDASTVSLSYVSAPHGTVALSTDSTALSGVATFSVLTFPSAGRFSLKATDAPLVQTTSKSFTLA